MCLILARGIGRLPGMALSDRDRAILDFERSWWMEPGSKRAAIERHFKMSSGRYYSLLGDLLESTEAAAYDPLVVLRLRRRRDQRRRARYEGTSAGEPPSQ
jgi:hypothetical protein